MFPISKSSVCRVLMTAAALFFVVAALAMMQRKEPFYTWFYSFAWWSFILFVESFLFSRGHRSLLFADPTGFLLLLPLSVTIWLIFEVFNFRLQNWHYLYLPPERGVRWLGYTIAYATVLPAIFTTRNLLDYFGLFRDTGKVPVALGRLKDCSFRIGIAMLVLPILFPNIFFPLVWLAFVFLLEPFNYRNGGRIDPARFGEGLRQEPLPASPERACLWNPLGMLEFLGWLKMGIYHPLSGIPESLRNADPRFSRLSPICSGMLCDGEQLFPPAQSHPRKPESKNQNYRFRWQSGSSWSYLPSWFTPELMLSR